MYVNVMQSVQLCIMYVNVMQSVRVSKRTNHSTAQHSEEQDTIYKVLLIIISRFFSSLPFSMSMSIHQLGYELALYTRLVFSPSSIAKASIVFLFEIRYCSQATKYKHATKHIQVRNGLGKHDETKYNCQSFSRIAY